MISDRGDLFVDVMIVVELVLALLNGLRAFKCDDILDDVAVEFIELACCFYVGGRGFCVFMKLFTDGFTIDELFIKLTFEELFDI